MNQPAAFIQASQSLKEMRQNTEEWRGGGEKKKKNRKEKKTIQNAARKGNATVILYKSVLA